MSKLTTHIDDLPEAAAKGRPQFYKAILYAAIFLVIALLAALFIIKAKGRKMLPGRYNPHPTSQLLLRQEAVTSAPTTA